MDVALDRYMKGTTMDKYYAWCGDIQFVVQAEDGMEAAVKAVNRYADLPPNDTMKVFECFVVNNRGFESASKGDGEILLLEDVLSNAGLL